MLPQDGGDVCVTVCMPSPDLDHARFVLLKYIGPASLLLCDGAQYSIDSIAKANSSCCTLHPRTTPFPEEKSMLGLIYGVLLWADMDAATPPGALGPSVISLDRSLYLDLCHAPYASGAHRRACSPRLA